VSNSFEDIKRQRLEEKAALYGNAWDEIGALTKSYVLLSKVKKLIWLLRKGGNFDTIINVLADISNYSEAIYNQIIGESK